MTGSSVLVSFSEPFNKQSCKVSETEKSEFSIHIVIVNDFVNKIVGPRTGGSFSHIREGKDNSFPMIRKFRGSCFEVKPELVNEWFSLVEVSSEDVRGIGFELLINSDWWCRRCRRRWWWRRRWRRNSCWID